MPSEETFAASAPPGTTAIPVRPELLAPAGDRDCLRAAIENGADAVYFGLDNGFNARARATNFGVDDLADVFATLHRRGVKGYVTLNTLVFPSELPAFEATARQVAAAGADAVLVQDLGVARLLRALCPELPLHASTQMTLTSAEGIRVVESLGIERVVLARELSVREIRKIHQQTTMPLEVFVHGALCVAYSGQCLTSESLGGRSANRGQCAQACRLPYDLICDGRDVDLGEQKYLLSPQDLAAYELVPELLAAGVSAFKIEGRLKTPEYVANITRHYRRAIDAAVVGAAAEFSRRDVEEMELSFSRGFSPGWLEGCDHKRLVPALSSSKRGVLLGEVVAIRRGRVAVRLNASVKRGDGVAFDCGRPVDDEQGGRVYEVLREGVSLTEPVAEGVAELTFAHGGIDFAEIWPGQRVWKTDDPALTIRLRKSFATARPTRRSRVDVWVAAVVGQPLTITARAGTGAECRVIADEPLVAAERRPATVDLFREQLGRLGDTAYQLGAVTADIVGGPLTPLSVLGRLRHEMVRRLDEASTSPPPRMIAAESPLAGLSPVMPPRTDSSDERDPPRVVVLCRTPRQLDDVLACGVDEVYVDYQDMRAYQGAVRAAREHGAAIWLAPPRIQKPDEAGIFRVLTRHGADGLLVRNLAGLDFCRRHGVECLADFSLNVANGVTARWLREQGAARLTASYDLNREQLLDLLSAVPADWLEIVLHQHMPMFHMEHCVFCAVLSPGTNKTNCGRPCDRHEVRLRDRVGMEHPLTADVGCRNTLFNAVPQSAAEVAPLLLARGVRRFRVELLAEGRDEIHTTLNLYRRLLAGQATGREVWTELRAANRVGVTRGPLEERRNPLAIL